jgi:hypothetical protein
MAYFNHAFQKAFLATGYSTNTGVRLLDGTVETVSTSGALVTTTGLPTYVLNEVSAQNGKQGYVGIFNPKTNLTIIPENCCNIYIAGSTLYSNDKIGPFHGGYQETNKSKMINPKYVSRMYYASACTPQNEVVHVGSTYWTAGGGIVNNVGILILSTYTPNLTNAVINLEGGSGTGAQVIISTDALGNVTNFQFVFNNGIAGKGYEVGNVLTIPGVPEDTWSYTVSEVSSANGDATCCKPFLCGETYSLRLDIKGSPALRFLNHNAYLTVDAYTGCCPADSIAPEPVDSTIVMIAWANQIINSPLINPFLKLVIQDQNGVLWYEPGTSATDLDQLGGNTWDNYVSTGYVEGACAGLIFQGAYVDTKFGNCTFQISDFYEKEPVMLYISEVDYNGDPCTFDGICVVKECEVRQANGLGETMVRELILSESYRQNFVSTDLRIREITQGNQIIDAIDRNALYDSLYLLHNVPRFNNPTGVFDNDQYLLHFIGTSSIAAPSPFPTPIIEENSLNELSGILGEWLNGCGVCELDLYTCQENECNSIDFPPLPPKGFRPNPGPRPGDGGVTPGMLG